MTRPWGHDWTLKRERESSIFQVFIYFFSNIIFFIDYLGILWILIMLTLQPSYIHPPHACAISEKIKKEKRKSSTKSNFWYHTHWSMINCWVASCLKKTESFPLPEANKCEELYLSITIFKDSLQAFISRRKVFNWICTIHSVRSWW